MSEFKVGDHVRFKVRYLSCPKGATAVVIEDPNPRGIPVRMDHAHCGYPAGETWQNCRARHLELIQDESADAILGDALDGADLAYAMATHGSDVEPRVEDMPTLEEAYAVFPLAEPPAPLAPSGSILAEALDITQGARNATHGPKERSFNAIAHLWDAYLFARKDGYSAGITGIDVSNMMILLKLGRSVQGQPVRDHYVDMAGYAALSGELAAAEAA